MKGRRFEESLYTGGVMKGSPRRSYWISSAGRRWSEFGRQMAPRTALTKWHEIWSVDKRHHVCWFPSQVFNPPHSRQQLECIAPSAAKGGRQSKYTMRTNYLQVENDYALFRNYWKNLVSRLHFCACDVNIIRTNVFKCYDQHKTIGFNFV